MNDRKEIDNNLNEVEENESLNVDCENTKGFRNKAMEIVSEIARRNLEELRKLYIENNRDMDTFEIDLINDYTNFLKSKA
jgi:2'-5' RNA ligase